MFSLVTQELYGVRGGFMQTTCDTLSSSVHPSPLKYWGRVCIGVGTSIVGKGWLEVELGLGERGG